MCPIKKERALTSLLYVFFPSLCLPLPFLWSKPPKKSTGKLSIGGLFQPHNFQPAPWELFWGFPRHRPAWYSYDRCSPPFSASRSHGRPATGEKGMFYIRRRNESLYKFAAFFSISTGWNDYESFRQLDRLRPCNWSATHGAFISSRADDLSNWISRLVLRGLARRLCLGRESHLEKTNESGSVDWQADW